MTERGRSDGRTGSGYGTLGTHGVGSDSRAEKSWPYVVRSELDVESEDEPIDGPARRAVQKQNKKHFASDKLQQLNYKTGSFINGQTRGLTGIMSGMDPMEILEAFVRTTIQRVVPRERIKPVGTGAPFSTMSADATTRTRPGMTLGSKAGWFGAPPPKDTDPNAEMPAFDLEDIAHNQELGSLSRANIERRRVLRKNRNLKTK